MNPELEKKLVEKYPKLFKNMGNLHASLMSFGFACGDGWYDLIENLCDVLNSEAENEYPQWKERMKDSLKDEELSEEAYWPEIQQVKEKYGGLRFYTSHLVNDTFDGACSFAERLSYTICEDCGNRGKLRDDIGWYRTLCDEHYNETKGVEK